MTITNVRLAVRTGTNEATNVFKKSSSRQAWKRYTDGGNDHPPVRYTETVPNYDRHVYRDIQTASQR